MDSKAAVTLERLTKTYTEGDREHAVLVDVDTSIARGASVAIRGRSGSGKSTLLNLIAGILPDLFDLAIDIQLQRFTKVGHDPWRRPGPADPHRNRQSLS